MTQALYAHMNNKRKKNRMCCGLDFIDFPALCQLQMKWIIYIYIYTYIIYTYYILCIYDLGPSSVHWDIVRNRDCPVKGLVQHGVTEKVGLLLHFLLSL
jgi:hypothetical protein